MQTPARTAFWRDRITLMLAACWWGGLGALSFVAVPTLFASLGGPALAGPVAARLFSLQASAGLVLGLLLLWQLNQRRRAEPTTSDATLSIMGLVMAAMLLALLQEFGVAQRIVSARATGGNLALWHGLGSLMVLGQWLCTGACLWRLSGLRSPSPE